MARFVTTKPVIPGKNGAVLEDDEWSRPLPAIWEYLTITHFSDGTPRRGSTLLLFCDDGVVKACLTDRSVEPELSLWVSGVSLGECLLALEKALASGTGEWRAKRPQGGTTRRKGG